MRLTQKETCTKIDDRDVIKQYRSFGTVLDEKEVKRLIAEKADRARLMVEARKKVSIN